MHAPKARRLAHAKPNLPRANPAQARLAPNGGHEPAAGAAEKTKSEFAEAAAARTALTTAEVMALAKTQKERETFAAVLAEVSKASRDNAAAAGNIRNIAGGMEALVKIASLPV